MSNLKDVVKKTLLRLQKAGQIATPKAYKEAFCIEAKNAGLVVEDCQWQARWMDKFDPKTKNQIQNYIIKTPDEFITLIAGILTRVNSVNDKESLPILKELLKILLRLHIFTPKISELAHETLLKFEAFNDPKVLTLFKDRWSDTLKSHTQQGDTSSDFAKILDPFLLPSISPVVPNEVIEIRSILKNSPSALFDKSNKEKLKLALLARIAIDKRESTHMGIELGEIIEILFAKLSALTQVGAHYQDEINSIHKALQEVIFDSKSFENAKNHLISLSETINERIQELNHEVEEKRSEIAFLSSRIEKLTSELYKVKEEVNTDPLTTTCTRCYMEESLNSLEGLFLRYKSYYSVVFFDIDHFKKINDQYGYEAGDKVLATLGRLLKQSARPEDVVVRYEGEKFAVLLPEMQKLDAWRFAQKIRILVEQSVFVYQDLRIRVTVSGGIADRNECDGRKSLLNLATSRLYEAKEDGRNQVRPLCEQKAEYES